MNKPISNLRDFKNAQMRRNFLEKELKTNLQSINSQLITDDLVEGKNIENLIGATQIPLGVAGPITINHHPRATSHYLPLATTEGALVASISRGAKAVTEASGATVVIHSSGITRGPVFKSNGVEHSQKAKEIITKNFQSLAKTAAKTSSHLKLKNIKIRFVGKNLYCRFSFDTQDAMGMNMATFASEEIARQIEKLTKVELVALAGNFDIDKKPSFLNFLSGRGKQAWADIIIPKKIVQSTLKTTPEKIVEIVKRKQHLGSIMSGSLGFNAHFANIIAAIFLATGQDVAHTVEGSLGITDAELEKNGDLYFSIYLPSLIVGTVGGGTNLPTQKEALKIMGIKNINVLEFARITAAAVLAGELSLTASLAQGTLAHAHKTLARNNNKSRHNKQ